MSDPELMTGLNYELLFLESLKLVVRPNHPLLQENVTLSRVLEWPVVVSPEGTAPRQHSDALVQSRGCKILRVVSKRCSFRYLVNLRLNTITCGLSLLAL